MVQSVLTIGHEPNRGWRYDAPSALPVSCLLAGRKIDDAIGLVSRVFNICAAAQKIAAAEAFGREVDPADRAALGRERIREHQRKLYIVLPRLLGVATRPETPTLHTPDETGLASFLANPADPAAGVLRALLEWPETLGQVNLPLARDVPDWPDATFGGEAVENSLALAYAGHPLLDRIEAERGRGPVWRVVLRLIDMWYLMAGADLSEGPVAARGRIFARATHSNGYVESYERLTPTDFLLHPGGLLPRLLAGVAPGGMQAAVLVELADPCVPWRWAEEVSNA